MDGKNELVAFIESLTPAEVEKIYPAIPHIQYIIEHDLTEDQARAYMREKGLIK